MAQRITPAPVGSRFGRLVVIKEVEPKISGNKLKRMVECECDCGNKTVTKLEALKSENTKSCGCLHKESFVSKQVIKSGDKFGRLTVIAQSESHVSAGGWFKRKWELMCDCGKKHYATTGSLTSGQTRSCGCLSAESSASNGRKSRAGLLNPMRGFSTVFSSYKSNAAKRSLCFEIDEELFADLLASDCHYCGSHPSNYLDISNQTEGKKIYRYNGVDRKDNSIGYTPENCVPCCYVCNHAKHTIEYKDFIAWILKASNHISKTIPDNF